MFTEVKTAMIQQVVLVFADEADARQFLVDPERAQFAVRAQLADLHDDGNRDVRRKNDANEKKARKASAPKKGAGKLGKHGKPAPSVKGLEYTCAECNHPPFSSAGYLARHERQVHAGVKPLEPESEDGE